MELAEFLFELPIFLISGLISEENLYEKIL